MWPLAQLVAVLVLVWHALLPVRDFAAYVPATLRPGMSLMAASRLPDALRPVHYDLSIFSDLQDLQFQGTVNITLDVLADTSLIQFHAGRNMRLSQVYVSTASGAHLLHPIVDAGHEQVRVLLPRAVREGERLCVVVGYRAHIDNSMRGYYYSTWEHEGRTGHYALTQMEPTSARRAYPGWDEPAYKATFRVRLLHRAATTAVANMPSAWDRAVHAHESAALFQTHRLQMAAPALGADAWTLTEFEETPVMAPYLVAWANGEFLHVAGQTTSPLTGRTIPLRLFATPESVEQAHFAVEVMRRVLPAYEEVFGIAYPLPKLDALVAADFDFGAMENWGLITGRHSAFLYDERSGLRGRMATAGIMSHEIAHMWFGNIATLAWWDSLWLNEAFATLMGELIVLDRVYPELGSSHEFLVAQWIRAMDLDAKRSSHQIEVPLQGDHVEQEITQLFDGITYSKGAAVLRMLAQMLGEDVFLEGVTLYLKAHLYGSTVTDDLWRGLAAASGVDVARVMRAWVQQQGFPVLFVTESAQGIRVRQHRCLETGDPTDAEDATLWHVPLALRTADGRVDQTYVLQGVREAAYPLPHAQTTPWKLNADTMGVYRVAYTPEHLAVLARAAAQRDSVFTAEDRLGLLNDAFTLAQAGYTNTSAALDLLHTWKDERSPLVLQAAALGLGRLASVWWEQPRRVRAAVDRVRQATFAPLARALTLEPGPEDTLATRELRTTVVAAAAAAGDAWTLQEIQRQFASLQRGEDHRLEPDLLRTVLIESVRHGGESEYAAALRMYHAPATPAHRTAALLALGSAQQPALIERTLAMVFGGQVKMQDMASIYTALSANTASRRRLWEATKERFDELAARLQGNFSLMGIVKAAISGLTSDSDREDIERFFAGRATSSYSMSLAQGLESVVAQTRWLERGGPDVEIWLQTHGYL